MDREITYTGQLLPASALLQAAKDPMIGLAKLAAAVLGTSSQINGFACTPTGPASMQVNIGPGEFYTTGVLDATAYGDLGTDAHVILKQGMLSDPILLTLSAPSTSGQSVAYLVQISLQDSDTASAVLPYYNSANPSSPFLGPNNTGASQATRRQTLAVVSIKAGSAATTGSQVAPAPDAGNVGAWVVTVANGQTTVTAPNIVRYAGAPFIRGLSKYLTNKVNVWNQDEEGDERIYFERVSGASSSTYVKGFGSLPFLVQNSATSVIFAVTSDGRAQNAIDGTAPLDLTTLRQVQNLIGSTRKWFDLTSSRAMDTFYNNGTGLTIQVLVSVIVGANTRTSLVINTAGSINVSEFGNSTGAAIQIPISFDVPPGANYQLLNVVGANPALSWAELR